MDLYTGFDGKKFPGLTSGIIGAREGHEAIENWKYMMLEWYGYRPNIWGMPKLLPMPCSIDSIHETSGNRFFTLAVYANLDLYENNNAIFKASVLNMDTKDKQYKLQIMSGDISDAHPEEETIYLGD